MDRREFLSLSTAMAAAATLELEGTNTHMSDPWRYKVGVEYYRAPFPPMSM